MTVAQENIVGVFGVRHPARKCPIEILYKIGQKPARRQASRNMGDESPCRGFERDFLILNQIGFFRSVSFRLVSSETSDLLCSRAVRQVCFLLYLSLGWLFCLRGSSLRTSSPANSREIRNVI